MNNSKVDISIVIKAYQSLPIYDKPDISDKKVLIYGQSPITKKTPEQFIYSQFSSEYPGDFPIGARPPETHVEPKVVVVNGKYYRLPVHIW